MAGIPPKKAAAYSFPVALVSRADVNVFQTNVTLAAGDIQVSKDGGQYANLATFPPAEILLAGGGKSGVLWVVLTATEMTADTVSVLFHDAAGGEWQDHLEVINTDSIQMTDIPTAGEISDAVWDEVLTGATHNVPTSAGRRLRQVAGNVVYEGTVMNSTGNTVVLDAGASAINGAYDPSMIVIIDGAGAGQCRLVLQYIGATRTAIVDRDWKANPAMGDTYIILGDAGREHVNEGLCQAGSTAGTVKLNALASSQDNAYIGQRVFIRSGTGADQARRINTYNGATKIATITRDWDIIPDATSAYVMLPTGTISDPDIAAAVWDAILSSHVLSGSAGEALWNDLAETIIDHICNVCFKRKPC